MLSKNDIYIYFFKVKNLLCQIKPEKCFNSVFLAVYKLNLKKSYKEMYLCLVIEITPMQSTVSEGRGKTRPEAITLHYYSSPRTLRIWRTGMMTEVKEERNLNANSRKLGRPTGFPRILKSSK